ncbi:MAG: GntR family transcriptional repressor for pyruvate dehydrogenase complex [Cognaticolwellia sp.]
MLATRNLADSATQTLRQEIIDGDWTIGRTLPSEARLSARFGISRLTMREALHRLRDQGLLQSRQGRGYTVQDFRSAGGPALISTLLTGADQSQASTAMADLLLVRRQLAQVVLLRLAQLRPPLQPISDAVDLFEDAAGRDASIAELAALDAQVMTSLLKATQSPVFGLFMNPLRETLIGTPTLAAALYRRPQDNVAAFRALLLWLKDPQPEGVDRFIALLQARDEQSLAQL